MSGEKDFLEGLNPEDRRHPFETIDRSFTGQSFLERTLPHSRDAEVALLSAVLRNNAVLEESAVARFKPEEFYRDAHRRILKTMLALHERNVPIEFATLAAELEKSGELDEVGGRIYLRALVDFPQADAIVAYVQIIRDKARLRNLIFLLNQCLSEAYESEKAARHVYGETLRKVWELGPKFFD